MSDPALRSCNPDAERAPDAAPPATNNVRLVDDKHAAALLAVGRSTFGRLRAAGRVGPLAVRLGGSVRFFLPELLAWIANPGPDGELYDAATWPAVWQTLQKRAAGAGR